VLDLGAYNSNDTPNQPSSYANRTEPVNATITHDEQSLIYEMTQFQSVPLAEALQRDKLYGAFPFLSLGVPMLWMGQEFSAPRGWANDGQKLNYRPLEWDWMLVQRGQDHFKWYRTLVNQRLKNPALYQGQLKRLFKYDAAKTLVWGFEDTTTNSKVMCVANLSPFSQTPTNLPWLGDGNWYDIFDQTVFNVSGGTVASFPINSHTIKVYSNKTNSELGITSVKQLSQNVPAEFRLAQNYPNPFNPSTTIRFEVPVSGSVTLNVYDMLGREVATLVDGQQAAGSYSAIFDASRLASGVYFYKLAAGSYTQVKRMSLVK
ncbi:MAG: T9SS type A sorting domain-containing protein, partial [Ignavibacteriales bacterium]|nr:T9SS type A sorting domain-containing protein [Ignavibacteriales bacterium]